jgi:hypothetical protein
MDWSDHAAVLAQFSLQDSYCERKKAKKICLCPNFYAIRHCRLACVFVVNFGRALHETKCSGLNVCCDVWWVHRQNLATTLRDCERERTSTRKKQR